MIQTRMNTKLLKPLHQGVYQVGPLPPEHLWERAAILACGPGALVSHRSAAGLWKLLPASDGAPVDLLVRGAECRRKGIRSRRVKDLSPEEVSEVDGIPVTSPPRTVLDLAGVAEPREVEQALAKAEREKLTTYAAVRSLLDRRPNRPGVRTLRRLLDAASEPALTRSEAEERFLALIRKARLPVPETNVAVGRYEVDFLWRRHRLAVEVDGYAFHSSKGKFEGDRRRDADLAAQGLRVVRVTWRQIVHEPEATLVRLARIIPTS